MSEKRFISAHSFRGSQYPGEWAVWLSSKQQWCVLEDPGILGSDHDFSPSESLSFCAF